MKQYYVLEHPVALTNSFIIIFQPYFRNFRFMFGWLCDFPRLSHFIHFSSLLVQYCHNLGVRVTIDGVWIGEWIY
jgi:hypothetical protein